jgi:hypothetical protein
MKQASDRERWPWVLNLGIELAAVICGVELDAVISVRSSPRPATSNRGIEPACILDAMNHGVDQRV